MAEAFARIAVEYSSGHFFIHLCLRRQTAVFMFCVDYTNMMASYFVRLTIY